MDWVPLWNRTLNNRKVQSLTGDVFKTWINLLCLASAVKRDGALPGIEQIAFDLRLDDLTADDHVGTLLDAGLIDADADGNMSIHDWDSWQLNSYRSTERVKRHREKKKQAVTGETFHAVPETACNGLEEKRREENTPLPPVGETDGVVAFGRITLGDRFDGEKLHGRLPGWRAAGYHDGWIKDAFMVASTANVRAGGLDGYIGACLRRWKAKGGPDAEQVRRAKGEPTPEAVVLPANLDIYGPKGKRA